MDIITEIRREIEQTFVPHVLARGFVIDRSEAPDSLKFGRSCAGDVQMFDIQWDKHGRPRFTINFASCPPTGLSIGGKHYAAKDVGAGWHGVSHGRLQPTTGLKQSWFGPDEPVLAGASPSAGRQTPGELVGVLLGLFPELEAYWASGAVGPHMWLMPHLRSKGH